MKRVYYLIILSIVLISCEKSILQFQSQNFIKYFGSGYESKGYDVIQIPDGYVITGYDYVNGDDYQAYICKVDENGNIVWETPWGNENRDEGRIIKAVEDGFLVAGTTNDGSTTHSFLLKLNSDGDTIWSKKYGGINSHFIVNDILITQDNIYLVGQYDSLKTNSYQSYIAQLQYNDGAFLKKRYISQTPYTSKYNKGFIQFEELLLVGTVSNATTNQVVLIPFSQSSFLPNHTLPLSDINLQTSDAIYRNDRLYVLANELNGTTKSLKVLKLNPTSSFQEDWKTDVKNGIEGKTFALKEDGSLLVCGDQAVGTADSKIYFIKVESNGTAGKSDEFRTFSGYAGKVIETYDRGIIMVGTTAPASNGTMIQLIKTDTDYFMLKK